MRMRQAAERNARQMDAVRGRMVDAVGASYLLARALSSPVKSAMEFQSAMADVRKVVDFETPAAFQQMGQDILDMSRRIALSASSIAAITAAAGQAGMAGAELLEFTELAAQASVAWDVSAGNAGESLAKIKTALGLTVGETRILAGAINHLSNKTASSAPDLVNYMRRVGSIGQQLGFSAEQTAALGAAMISAGAPAEVAATSFRKVGGALARGTAATNGQKEAFAELGLSATKVAKHMQEDAVGTLRAVIARIRELPKHMQASMISKLFGDEARAIAPLIENVELLDKSLGLLTDRTAIINSVTEEFEIRSQTAENKLQLFKNKAEAMAISLGNALLPAITSVTEVLGPLIDAIATFASANPQTVVAITALIGGLVGLRVATIAARWAFLFLKGGVLDIGIAAGRSAGLVVAATKRMRLAVLGASMLSGVGGAGMFTGLVAGISSAASAIVPAAAGIGAAIAGITAPIWAIVAAVAAVALAFYRYWEPISNFVTGFASAIYDAVEPLISFMSDAGGRIAAAMGDLVVDRVVDAAELLGFDPVDVRAAIENTLASLSDFGGRIGEILSAIPGQIGDWVSDIFSMKDYSAQAEAGFRDAGRRAGEAMVKAVKDAINAMVEWFSGLPARIISAIGSIDISSLIDWPSPPDWLLWIWNGGAKSDAPKIPAVDGARAAGGPVAGGRTYLVGERGPELFTAPRSGQIVPNDQMTGAGAAPATGAPMSVSIGDIHIHGAQDVDGIVAEIETRLREAFEGLQADMEYAVG